MLKFGMAMFPFKTHVVGDEFTDLQIAIGCPPMVRRSSCTALMCTLPLRQTGGGGAGNIRSRMASLADQFTKSGTLAFLPILFLVGGWVLSDSLLVSCLAMSRFFTH